jgi:hypothetical protein
VVLEAGAATDGLPVGGRRMLSGSSVSSAATV